MCPENQFVARALVNFNLGVYTTQVHHFTPEGKWEELNWRLRERYQSNTPFIPSFIAIVHFG
jgi:hypothetical protein